MTRLYITGGRGFIARHFLQTHSYDFEVICAPHRREPSVQEGHIERPKSDGSAEDLCRILKAFKPDVVVNFAASGVKPNNRDADNLTRTNATLAAALFSSARDCGAQGFVQIGSMAEYAAPDTARPLLETDALTYTNRYGTSKAAATLLLSSLAESAGIATFTLRLFGVYGPGELPHRLTSHILKQTQSGALVELSAGTQQRDFIYIRDVVSAISAAINSSLSQDGGHEIINIGSGQAISVKDFVLDFCAAGNLPTSGLKFGSLPMRDTDAPYLVADISKAKRLLNWTPKWNHHIGLRDFFKML